MKTVHVFTAQGKRIIVDGQERNINFSIPFTLPENFFFLTWADNFHGFGVLNNDRIEKIAIEPSAENYAKYAQPFVDQFEADLAQNKDKELAVQEIDNLKSRLAETDYVVTKIAEGVATKEEYADILENRAVWRRKINELETSLASNESDLKA